MDLQSEIKSSLTFKLYNKIQKLSKYIKTFKWIVGISFVLGFLNILLFEQPLQFISWMIFTIWLPGLLFVFVGGALHFLTGRKITILSNKYGKDKSEIIKLL